MQRWMLSSCALLVMIGAAMPAISAEVTSPTTSTANTKATSVVLTPYDVAFMAYQGQFRSQGIPSSGGLTSAHQWGRINARTIVEKAIQANLLAPERLNDRGFIKLVDANLRALATR